jgi:Terpene synthase family 2, C-terminal metal binding
MTPTYSSGQASAHGPGRDPHRGRALPAPMVFCPFLPMISPYAVEVERYAVHWATRYGLLGSAQAQSTLAAAKFAHLGARAYPRSTRADVCLATAWLIMTFQLDDMLETTLGRQPEKVRAVTEGIVAFFGAGGSAALPRAVLGRPLCQALQDVWRRTRDRASSAWRDRFAAHFGAYLAGTEWEAGNRAAGRVPPLAEYRRMRRQSVALEVFFDLVEPLGRVEVPATAAADERYLELRRAAVDVVAWFNDLVSWPKEEAAGDPHNLVLVLRHERRTSIDDAIYAAAAEHDARMHTYLAARERLAATPLIADPGVRTVLAGVEHWIRGNIDWSQESGRYELAVDASVARTPID